MTTADSCRMREIEGVGSVEVVCGRTNEDGWSIFSTDCLVWGSVAGEFTGKGELDVTVVREVT